MRVPWQRYPLPAPSEALRRRVLEETSSMLGPPVDRWDRLWYSPAARWTFAALLMTFAAVTVVERRLLEQQLTRAGLRAPEVSARPDAEFFEALKSSAFGRYGKEEDYGSE